MFFIETTHPSHCFAGADCPPPSCKHLFFSLSYFQLLLHRLQQVFVPVPKGSLLLVKQLLRGHWWFTAYWWGSTSLCWYPHISLHMFTLSFMKLMLAHCGLHIPVRGFNSIQINSDLWYCRVSVASSGHYLICWVCLCVCVCICLVVMYASFTFAYSKSKIYCLWWGSWHTDEKVGRLVEKDVWLRSPVMIIKAFGCHLVSMLIL